MDTDPKWVINEEERTRHDALFYSQNPKKGYLSGEQARSLFIRSRLPLSELSKIWKLADISRDNLLDVSEFSTAMHLIQLRLRGSEIPEKLPTTLTPVRPTITVVPPMTTEEWNAYNKTFVWKDTNNTGFIDTETACGIMLLSNLNSSILSKIWNLSDIDRDAKLSLEEFAIAFHLLRCCKNGNELEGSIDVKAMLPIEALKDDGEAKKKKHADVQAERRQLLALKQKLCSEIASGLDNAVLNEKIQPELNKVEDRLFTLEKEETELRRSLLNLRDRTKKESFKPFDKSFLLKKRISGEDLFKDRDKKPSVDEDSALFERLWILNGPNLENTVPSKENQNGPTLPQISLNDNYSSTQPSDITFTEVKPSSGAQKSTSVPRIVNGLADSEDNKAPSGGSAKFINYRKENSSAFDSAKKGRDPTSEASGQNNRGEKGSNLDHSVTKKEVVEEKVEERLAKPRKKVERDESFSWARIEKRPVITQRVHEEVIELPDKKDKQKRINYKGKKPVQEDVSVGSVENVESAADQNIDKLFKQMSVDMENGAVNGVDYEGGAAPGKHKLPVGRVLSDEEEKQLVESGALKKAERKVSTNNQPTQEDLLPIYLEERKLVEEERRKKREIEEEKRRQAREDMKRQDEERYRELMERKGAMQEARGRLEKHLSQSDKDVQRSDAGYLIEKELEEQRLREEEAQKRIEDIRRNELMHPKVKDQKSQAKQVYIDTGKPPDNKPHPIVVRRPKTEPKHQGNRKSWVELEIEEQKRKDEEMRREIEQRQSDLNRLVKDQKPMHAIKKDIEIKESSIRSTTTQRTVESQPPAAYMGTKSTPYSDVNREVAKAQRPASMADRNTGGIRHQGNVREDSTPVDIVDGKITAEEKEIERRIQEEEEKRRLQQIEQIRIESRKREAEELMRKKAIRDEELRIRKENALREAEKRKLEEEMRLAEAQKVAESRRLAFHTQKVILEERVINTMKEAQIQSQVVLRTKKSSNEDQDVSRSDSTQADDTEKRERRKSVRDTKALFEQSAPNQEQSKVVMRKKRQSLNLEDSGQQQKPSRKDRASFYSDGTTTQEYQTQVKREKEIRIVERDGGNNPAPTRLNLGNLSEKRQQFEGQRQQSVEKHQPAAKEKHVPNESKSPPAVDQQDGRQLMTESFFPSISNNKIQQEMEELRQREHEIQIRRQAMIRTPSSDKQLLDNTKKDSLPSKMQAQKGSSTASDVVVRRRETEQKSAPKKEQVFRKSFIELEKEKEREREEELQREREARMREMEEQKKKKEEEAEEKRKTQEEKERKKSKPNNMAARWQNRGQYS